MNATHKFEKDEQVSLVYSEMISSIKELHDYMHIDDLTSYFTDVMRLSVSNQEDEAYSLSYIDNIISSSSKLLNINMKLFLLLAKYNKLTNQN